MDSKTIKKDVDLMIEAMRLQDVVRYRFDPYWVAENNLQDKIEKNNVKRLESDADHSWHLSDMVMTLGPKWPELDLGKATQMAVIHDKMEIFTGDMVAVGLSGNGSDSHAFNDKLKAKKRRDEDRAFERYLAKLHSRSRSHIREIYEEYHAKKSSEARFVDALDKLEPFVRILYAKKDKYAGNRQAEWLEFCERYHKPRVAQFPDLLPYAEEMLRRIKNRRT